VRLPGSTIILCALLATSGCGPGGAANTLVGSWAFDLQATLLAVQATPAFQSLSPVEQVAVTTSITARAVGSPRMDFRDHIATTTSQSLFGGPTSHQVDYEVVSSSSDTAVLRWTTAAGTTTEITASFEGVDRFTMSVAESGAMQIAGV